MKTNRPVTGPLRSMFKNIPWKTVGLVVVVSLVVVALVKRNTFGLGNLTNPPTA